MSGLGVLGVLAVSSLVFVGLPMRTTWSFHTAGQFLFGRHATRQLGAIAVRMGLKRVLLVTDPVLLKGGLSEPVRAALRARFGDKLNLMSYRLDQPEGGSA